MSKDVDIPRLAGPGQPSLPLTGDPIGRVAAPLPTRVMAADAVLLHEGLSAALAGELMRLWDVSSEARSVAATEYAAARQAATQAATPQAAVLHLERAVRAHPEFAVAAGRDPDFAPVRESVAAFVSRITAAAHLEADQAMSRAGEAIAEPAMDDREASAILQAAESRYLQHTYAGYFQATVAARLAERVAREGRVRHERVSASVHLLPLIATWAARAKSRVSASAKDYWRRLPLLVVLLGWLAAGMLFGGARMVLGIRESGRWIFPVWGMGLLAIVAAGFLRSVRRSSRRGAVTRPAPPAALPPG